MVATFVKTLRHELGARNIVYPKTPSKRKMNAHPV
jgi:hypothetical protein